MPEVNWRGVFPAVPTQFREDFSVDIDATIRHIDVLLKAGCSRARDVGDSGGKLLRRVSREN
jgi:dihydrodipicolinate synthase/N-acetylneuraminate lyase